MTSPAAPALSDRAILRPPSRRRAVLIGAALAGGVLGSAFATEIVHAAAGVWSAYMVPAFFEMLLSGIPFCG